MVEGALFVLGVGLYLSATRACSWEGHVSLWSFIALMLILYAGDASGSAPPPSVRVLILVSFLGWLAPPWGLWMERTRCAV